MPSQLCLNQTTDVTQWFWANLSNRCMSFRYQWERGIKAFPVCVR